MQIVIGLDVPKDFNKAQINEYEKVMQELTDAIWNDGEFIQEYDTEVLRERIFDAAHNPAQS